MSGRTLYLVAVNCALAGCYERSALALTIDAPPECLVRDAYGFECHSKYLAGLEQQIESVLGELASHNAAHGTQVSPSQSQSAWVALRQTRCGVAPAWVPAEADQSFSRIECYIEMAEKRFDELDTLVREL